MKDRVTKKSKKSNPADKTTSSKKQGNEKSSDSMQDKIDQIIDWIDVAKSDMAEMKNNISMLNNSIQTLTKAIISNEDNNRSNINQLVDSISVLAKQISDDIEVETIEVNSNIINNTKIDTPKTTLNKKKSGSTRKKQ